VCPGLPSVCWELRTSHYLASGAKRSSLYCACTTLVKPTGSHPVYFKRLVTLFLLRRPGLSPWVAHVGFVVAEWHWDRSIEFALSVIIPPLLHTYLSSGAGTVGLLEAALPCGSISPPTPTTRYMFCFMLGIYVEVSQVASYLQAFQLKLCTRCIGKFPD
jgi:hypothetical protein